jgi:hypothetical protein
MAIVTGNLSTFGRGVPSVAGAMIRFVPSSPATSGSKYLLSSIRVPVFVAVDGSGSFSANLEPTETTRPGTYYKVEILVPDSENEFQHFDDVPWPLLVPPEGGDIGDLFALSANPALAWIGAEYPGNQPPAIGTWWANSDPESEDYGWLLEWE